MLERHPLSALFPDMGEAEFEELVAHMAEYGQQKTILLYEGQVVDGWHRYRACMELGIEPQTRTLDDQSWERVREVVIAENLHRRHLTPGQRADIVVALHEWRQRGGNMSEPSNDGSLTRAEQAEEAHVSVATIDRARERARGEDEPEPTAEDGTPLPPKLTRSEQLQFDLDDANAEIVRMKRRIEALTEEARGLRAAIDGDTTELVDAQAKELESLRSGIDDWIGKHSAQTRTLAALKNREMKVRRAATDCGPNCPTHRALES